MTIYLGLVRIWSLGVNTVVYFDVLEGIVHETSFASMITCLYDKQNNCYISISKLNNMLTVEISFHRDTSINLAKFWDYFDVYVNVEVTILKGKYLVWLSSRRDSVLRVRWVCRSSWRSDPPGIQWRRMTNRIRIAPEIHTNSDKYQRTNIAFNPKLDKDTEACASLSPYMYTAFS